MYLNCHTYYSLRYGTLSPDELVEEALKQNVDTLALTDINNTTGIIDFVSKCRKTGVHPIGGIEFRDGNYKLLYTVIAANNGGFKEINDLLSWHNINKTPLPPCPPVFSNAFTIYPKTNKLPRKLKEHEYVGVRPGEVRRLISSPLSKLKSKLVAFHPVTFAGKNDFQVHRYLRAIDKNTLLSKLTAEDLAHQAETFLPPPIESDA